MDCFQVKIVKLLKYANFSHFRRRIFETEDILQDYLRAAAKRPFAREDARRLVEFGLAEEGFEEAALVFVKKRLRELPPCSSALRSR